MTNSYTNQSFLSKIKQQLTHFEHQTRPNSTKNSNSLPTSDQKYLESRYNALPEHIKTDSQILGKITPGCEGTQGVFPRCGFACKPCYHSAESNGVRTDPLHTIIEVARQMDFLKDQRGPAAHCQLIGGEVSLLSPEDHAKVIQIMKSFGRLPMSFTHGDFDYEYVRELAIESYVKNEIPRPISRFLPFFLRGIVLILSDFEMGRNGLPSAIVPKWKRRVNRLDWAVHFDRFMVGRRGAKNLKSEIELNPFRERFIQMMKRLEKEYGVRTYVAHNYTVQEGNLNEIPDVIQACKRMGFRLMSFQPAAAVGLRQADAVVGSSNEVISGNGYDDDGESVWKQIEKGAGCKLPYKVAQTGDFRCNRTVWGAFVGPEKDCIYVPFLSDDCEQDLELRDLILDKFGLAVMPLFPLMVKLVRFLIQYPKIAPLFIGWIGRFVSRAGFWRIISGGIYPLTFVMHRFMDAEYVKPAWELLQNGELAPKGRLRDTQERLQACSYAMAQPDSNQLVPACVQHSVYDPEINKKLTQLLPLSQPPQPIPHDWSTSSLTLPQDQ